MIRQLAMLSLFLPLLATGCGAGDSGRSHRNLQATVDSLKKRVEFMEKNYKPGFGQAMVKLERHYHNLWLAAESKDWKRASFEAHEVEEGFEKLVALHNTKLKRPLQESVEQDVGPALELIEKAAEERSPVAFRSAYDRFTATCNNCHIENGLDFLVMRRPMSAGR